MFEILKLEFLRKLFVIFGFVDTHVLMKLLTITVSFHYKTTLLV